ncbi:class II fructose-bisphosphate aldolase [Gloeobacter violaceus]|uniref:D-tagatose-bisphosphate aldolase class II n=1 Tax=Gloeobacter violaceus (strain ATCC 29082 / PCC 7421) TaxID=251221 RepID=Q7NHK2_GLOVI|nr:class II fructose-bisphosphate aldolase [Gloeobacter violaceus]BAC90474.1 glr2533 [Gloeobacter violaceus PCC 7421]
MLSSTIELLRTARRSAYAIGAFNIYNLEGVLAVVRAAEETASPAMLQLHPSALRFGGPPLVALCLEAARESTVPIAVHLDHSSSAQDIRYALEVRLPSVMADGSHLPYQQNLEFTRQMTRLAHSFGAAVEAEIGRISGSEDGLSVSELEAKMTDPLQAREFVEATEVDALAVTIGNVHGKYRGEPKLDFDRLARIRELIEIPLVLHGTSGLPAELIGESIRLGVCKFNVNTEVRGAYLRNLKESFTREPAIDLLDLMEGGIAAMQSVVRHMLELFGSVGKAHLHQSPYTASLMREF